MAALSGHYPEMAVGRITKRAIDAIPLPAGTARTYLWDDTLKGFGVMVTGKGARSYLVQYQIGGRGAPTRRVTIGRHGAPWTTERARERATDLLEMIRKGIDPVEHDRQRRAAEMDKRNDDERLAFAAYAELFGTKYVDKRELRSGGDIKAVFRRDLTPIFNNRAISSIRRSEVSDALDAIASRSVSAAMKAHKWLRKMFAWAVDRGDLAASPMISMAPPGRDGQRSRYLAGLELRVLWLGADKMADPYRSFVKVLLLAGQRLREVAGMQWGEVDLAKAEWLIPGERTKNKRPHLVPLSESVVGLLATLALQQGTRSGPVFTTDGAKAINGFSKPKALLDQHVASAVAEIASDDLPAMRPWVFHDLRRSFSTGAQALGFPIEHTEAALNHVSGKRGGLVGVYQLYEYQQEKAAIMAAWSRHVETIVHDQQNNVIAIRGARA